MIKCSSCEKALSNDINFMTHLKIMKTKTPLRLFKTKLSINHDKTQSLINYKDFNIFKKDTQFNCQFCNQLINDKKHLILCKKNIHTLSIISNVRNR